MITINAQTKEVLNAREHEPQVYGHFGYNITPGYIRAWCEPNYPMPAIPLAVKYDYRGCINIDDMTDENDPVIVYMYDSWTRQNI